MKLLKTIALAGLLSVGVIVRGYCGDAENADLKMWQERASKIKKGTEFSEVKKILGITDYNIPPYYFQTIVCSGPHCMSNFALDKNVEACIDWQTKGSNSPINKITVRIIPPVKITDTSIKSIPLPDASSSFKTLENIPCRPLLQ